MIYVDDRSLCAGCKIVSITLVASLMFRQRTLCTRVEDFKFARAEPKSGKNFRITALFSGYTLGRKKLSNPNISNASPFIFTARPKATTPSTEAAYGFASTTIQATVGLISLGPKN